MEAVKNSIGTNSIENVSNRLNEVGNSLKSTINGFKGTINNSLSEFSSKVAVNNAGSDFLNSNSIVAKFAFLILVLIIFVIICNLGITLIGYFTQPSKTPYVVHGLLNGTNALVVSQDPALTDSVSIVRSNNENTGIEFSWSVWLILSNNSSENKLYQNIFNKGDSVYSNGISQVNNGPGLYLSSLINNENNLHVVMDTVDPSVGPATIDITGVPFNKWFHVTIRLENKILDVYMNGTVAHRYNMKSVPKQNYNEINICQNGGFNGQLSNLRYYNYALSAFEINNIVLKGPNLKMNKLDSNNYFSWNHPYFLSNTWYTSQR